MAQPVAVGVVRVSGDERVTTAALTFSATSGSGHYVSLDDFLNLTNTARIPFVPRSIVL